MRQIERNDRSADVEEKEGRRWKEERGRYLYCCLQRVNACYDSLYPEA